MSRKLPPKRGFHVVECTANEVQMPPTAVVEAAIGAGFGVFTMSFCVVVDGGFGPWRAFLRGHFSWEVRGHTLLTMATATQIGLIEYLATSYRPDCEYVDGEVRERNVGKWEHARIQWLLAGWFGQRETLWDVIGSTEQRVQVSGTRVRVPDLVVMRPGPQPDVLREPPLLVVEILSPDDSYWDLQERCQDYVQMGVETVWIIDPKTRSGRMCTGAEWAGAERLEVAGTPIYVELGTLFARLDGVKPDRSEDGKA